MPTLTVYERSIIYKYSEDGYEYVNETLRKSSGASITEFGKVLNSSLSKLENYEGLVFRGVELNPSELQQYIDAMAKNEVIVENAFISATKSQLTAFSFGRNARFIIYSKTGKEIEKIAKFGKHHPQNEKEVLFKSGRSFTVLDVTKEQNYTLITMEEL